jgi:hypothetical protein
MQVVFPYANVVVGALVLVVGFGLHWIGQVISLCNWEVATRIGLQEQGMPPEYKVYEHALAVADVAIGWTYGIAGVGLILDTSWGYTFAWFPGVVLTYHSISAWCWHRNQKQAGRQMMSDACRMVWCIANFVAGALTILVAWSAISS